MHDRQNNSNFHVRCIIAPWKPAGNRYDKKHKKIKEQIESAILPLFNSIQKLFIQYIKSTYDNNLRTEATSGLYSSMHTSLIHNFDASTFLAPRKKLCKSTIM